MFPIFSPSRASDLSQFPDNLGSQALQLTTDVLSQTSGEPGEKQKTGLAFFSDPIPSPLRPPFVAAFDEERAVERPCK